MDKEFTSILYIYDATTSEDLSIFSKSNGFILYTCDAYSKAGQDIPSRKPDFLLIECGEGQRDKLAPVLDISITASPIVFLVIPTYLDASTRMKLIDAGVDDIIVKPLLIKEVQKKFSIYQHCLQVKQENDALEKQRQTSMEYLDTFKDELKKVKEELFEERTTLNSALKQINQMSVERKRLKKDKLEIKTRLSENVQGVFDIFCKLIEVRLEKNRGHGSRVSHIVDFTGRQFKLDEKKLDDLSKAAMLHEIGLLFIPEDILHKSKTQLTTYEQDLFVQYPVKGAKLLSCCPEFGGAAKIIHHLNENSDGTGSPDGLKRRYIPLMSRILAGADVFDWLKDQKEVTSMEIFLERLEEFSGSRLDPGVVAVLEKYAVLHMGSDAYQVKGVGIHQLEPGMTLGTAIFTNTGTKLFSVNTLLTPDAIDKIKNYNRAYPVDETVYIRA